MIILHFHLQPQFKMNYFIYTSLSLTMLWNMFAQMWYIGIVTLLPTAWLFLRGKRQSTQIYGVGLIRHL